MTKYYDMKPVTFGVDDHHSMAITFPVSVKAFNRKSLVFDKIETVPVPINDLNKVVDSYKTVPISKAYKAINDE